MLRCADCNKSVAECQCPGADERLREAVFSPDMPLATKWCRTCDKHYARCKCGTPDFFYVADGQEVTQENDPAFYELLKSRDRK